MQRQAGIVPLITNVHGWGVHALYLARQMLARGIQPVPLWAELPQLHLPDSELLKLQPVFTAYRRQRGPFLAQKPRAWPTFHAGGNWPAKIEAEVKVAPEAHDVCCMVFEDCGFEHEDIEYLKRFGGVFSVSKWNADALAQHGFAAPTLHLGVDTGLFKPAARSDRFGRGKFVVFSAGKAELRKGQDIVLAAFKDFAESHPDAVLVTAWHNLWPGTARSLEYSPHGAGSPSLVNNENRLNIRKWASDFGLKMGQFIDIGMVSNRALAGFLSGVDVAVFPNRCEGGTNMVAMECLAAGVPCILSENTGHLDLLADFEATPLQHQTACTYKLPGWRDLRGWAEPQVDEVVAALELAYQRRPTQREAAARNAAVAQRSWGWPLAMDRQIDYLARIAQWDSLAA